MQMALPAPRVGALSGHKDSINVAAASSHDQLVVATGGDDKGVRLWHLSGPCGGASTKLLLGAAEGISALTFDPGDPWRIWAASGSRLLCWDLGSPEVIVRSPLASLLYSSDDVSGMAVLHGSRLLVTVDDDGSVCLVNADSHKLVKIVRRAHTSLASCVAARQAPVGSTSCDTSRNATSTSASSNSSNGGQVIDFATGGMDNRILFWSSSSAAAPLLCFDTRTLSFQSLANEAGGSSGSSKSLDRRKGGSRGGGLSGSRRGTAAASSAARGAAPSASTGDGTPDGNNSASADGEGSGASSNQLVNPPYVHSLAWSHDGRYLAAALGNGSLIILQPEASSIAGHLAEAHAAPAVTVGWVRVRGKAHGSSGSTASDGASSDDGCRSYLVSSGNDGVVCLWQQQSSPSPPPQPPAAPTGASDTTEAAAEADPRLAEASAAFCCVWRGRHGKRGPNWVLPIDAVGTSGAGYGWPMGTGTGTVRDGGGLLVCDVTKTATLYGW